MQETQQKQMSNTNEYAGEKTQAITQDMTISEVITRYPAAVEVLLRNGIHCIGCGANTFEALGDGLRGHGTSEAEVARIMQELNECAQEFVEKQKSAKTAEGIQVTEKAVAKLKDLIAQNNKVGYGLRVQVIPGGCAGFQYGFDFEDTAQKDDTVMQVNGVNFYVDQKSMDHLSGSVIDYIDTLQEAGFRISNPNASSGCGCGKSFS